MARYVMLDSRSDYRNVAKYDMCFRDYGQYCGNAPVGIVLRPAPPIVCRRAAKFKRSLLVRKMRNGSSRKLNLRGRVVRSNGRPVIARNRPH